MVDESAICNEYIELSLVPFTPILGRYILYS